MFILPRPILHQTLAIIPVAFAHLMSGLTGGWISPTLQILRSSQGHISLTDEDCSWMVSAQYPGYFLGCLLSTLLTDRFGRNSVIVLTAVSTLVSWAGVILAKTVLLLELSYMASGVSAGTLSVIMSIYIGENSSPQVRGVFSSICSLLIDVGMLLGCTLATYCSYHTTAYLLAAVSVVNLASNILLKEPAQHLLAKGFQAKAESRFFWLRGIDDSSKKEFKDLKSSVTKEKPQFSLSFLSDRNFLIVFALSCLRNFTGYPAVEALVSIIFEPTQLFSSNELAILFNFFQLLGSVVSPFIIDRFGRRPLWMLSAILVAISHFLAATLYILKNKGLEIAIHGWLLFACITAYASIYSAAMYPLGGILKAELLPQKFKTIGTSTSTMINSLVGMMVGHSFLWISANCGVQTNFICYGIFSSVIFVVVYFYLPETKDMSLVEIEKLLANQQSTDF